MDINESIHRAAAILHQGAKSKQKKLLSKEAAAKKMNQEIHDINSVNAEFEERRKAVLKSLVKRRSGK